MRRLTAYFTVSCLALAVIALFTVYLEGRSQWRRHQESFLDVLLERAVTEKEKEAATSFQVKIRQDWLPGLGRADRCRSCHVGVGQGVSIENTVLSEHPQIPPHDFRLFGCSVCHGGDGLATRLPDAHKGLIPMALVEGGCGTCHDPLTVEEAPTLRQGRLLMEKYNCLGCHDGGESLAGSGFGPDLSRAGLKLKREWLSVWLKEPGTYLGQPRMADFLLNRQEIDDLSAFLLAGELPGETGDEFGNEAAALQALSASMSESELDQLAEEGRVLFGRLRCISCHGVNGKGGNIGPDLGRISLKTGGGWIGAWLNFPRKYDPQTSMPAFNVSRREGLAIAEYLLIESSLAVDDEFDSDGDERAGADSPVAGVGDPAAGAKHFTAKGCTSCHRFRDLPGRDNFAPSLAGLADKSLEKIDFGDVPIPHSLAEYVSAKLQSPRAFPGDLKMPYFRLEQEEVGRLSTVLMATGKGVPASYLRRGRVQGWQEGGEMEAIVRRYNCRTCHRFQGKGGDLAPELDLEGSQVNQEWLEEYLRKPYAIRPFLVERMPRFNLSDQEVRGIADYARLVWRSRAVDQLEPRAAEVGDSRRGEKLYNEKYNCQSCHAIGTAGGYYGPALDIAGRRLRPAWILARLDNVHKFTAGAREPALQVAEEDRADLFAFLAGLTGVEQ